MQNPFTIALVEEMQRLSDEAARTCVIESVKSGRANEAAAAAGAVTMEDELERVIQGWKADLAQQAEEILDGTPTETEDDIPTDDLDVD